MAKDFLREQVESGKDRVAERLGDAADVLRARGEQLAAQGNEAVAKFAAKVANRVQDSADYLARTDAAQLGEDVQAFARQRPWLVVVVGLAIGLTVSRVVKALAAERAAHRFRTTVAEEIPLTAYGSP